MPIGDTFPFSVPLVGSAGPSYAQSVNDILTEAINRLSVKVPLTSIDFNAQADLAGSSILNAGYITLVNSVSSPAASPINRLTAFNGDFWYVGPSGPIQITTGALLNAAAIGGITGDYGGANPAQFRFVDADQRYDAYDNFATSTFGLVRARGFDISAAPVSAVFARLAFGGSVTRTYTLPPAPASSADPRPLYMTNTGAITVGHTSKTFRFSAIGAVPASGSYADLSPTQLGVGNVGNSNAAAQSFVKAIDGLPEGFIISNVTINVTKMTTGLTGFAVARNINGAVGVALGSQSSTSIGAQAISINFTETVATNASYSISANLLGFQNDRWSGFSVTGSIPA